MLLNICLLLIYNVILCSQFELSSAKAMIGQNVRQAGEKEFPFVVPLLTYNDNKQLVRFCTGTLVSRIDILTAEHCLENKEPQNIKIIVGSNDLRSGPIYDTDWWVSYNQWALLNSISTEFEKNDIALIKLSRFVPSDIKPAGLSKMSNQDLYNLNVVIAGWGNSNNGEIPSLMETVDVKVLTNTDCENRARTFQGKANSVHERLLCTAATPFALLNFGDSGDPLLYNNEIVAVSFGTYLFRDHEFHPEKVNLHFGIQYYMTFILDIINNF